MRKNKPRFQGTGRVPKESFKVDLYIDKKFENVCDLWYKKGVKKKYILRNQSYQSCYDKALFYVTGVEQGLGK